MGGSSCPSPVLVRFPPSTSFISSKQEAAIATVAGLPYMQRYVCIHIYIYIYVCVFVTGGEHACVRIVCLLLSCALLLSE